MGISITVESQTLKILFRNLTHVITPGTSPQIGLAGVLPKYAKYNTFVTF